MNFNSILCAAVLSVVTGNAFADDLIFAAPPRGPLEKEAKVYQPIVDLLANVTGKKVVFKYTDNWLTYDNDMQKDLYDFVFDGPHFIGWRMAKLQHVPLAKLEGNLGFVLIARSDNPKVKELKDLAGRSICAFAPPNLATLTILSQFQNPARQPIVREINKGFKEAFDGVISKRCDGAVLQGALYGQWNSGPNEGATKVLFKSKPLPNQGLTAGKRVPVETHQKIIDALFSPQGQEATKNLREGFKKELVPVSKAEYDGLGVLLKDVWGFDL